MSPNTPIKVLIVDDEDRFRETTALILTRRGFAATPVGNGLEALDKIKQGPFDVVILDVKMPGMNGNEALREIKRLRPETQVIMLTGFGTPKSALDGLKEGVFDYLSKPCNLDLLAQRIRAAFAKERNLPQDERRVADLMVPIASFSAIRARQSVAEAIEKIMRSFESSFSTAMIQDAVHSSILVLDQNDAIIGIINFTDLLSGLRPPETKVPPEAAPPPDGHYPGMFTFLTRNLAKKEIRELLPEKPPFIDADENLMNAAAKLHALSMRRLLVADRGKIVGVLREQDLFLEMANIISQYF